MASNTLARVSYFCGGDSPPRLRLDESQHLVCAILPTSNPLLLGGVVRGDVLASQLLLLDEGLDELRFGRRLFCIERCVIHWSACYLEVEPAGVDLPYPSASCIRS
jgi:hypothetical protein